MEYFFHNLQAKLVPQLIRALPQLHIFAADLDLATINSANECQSMCIAADVDQRVSLKKAYSPPATLCSSYLPDLHAILWPYRLQPFPFLGMQQHALRRAHHHHHMAQQATSGPKLDEAARATHYEHIPRYDSTLEACFAARVTVLSLQCHARSA